jgi:hypothetical protein
MSFILKALLGGILLLTTSAVAPAAENTHGAVMQSGGSILQNPSLPKLNLNTAQREQVRQALLTKHTEVEFRLKATKSAKSPCPFYPRKRTLRHRRKDRRDHSGDTAVAVQLGMSAKAISGHLLVPDMPV